MKEQIFQPNADALAQAVADLETLAQESIYDHSAVLELQAELDPENELIDEEIKNLVSRKHRRLWKELKTHLYNPTNYEPASLDREEKKVIGRLLKLITATTSDNFHRIALLSNTLFGLPDTNTLLSEYPPFVRMRMEEQLRVYVYAELSRKYYERVIR